MKFDKKDPITISLISLVVVTLFSYLLLYNIKPEFVTKLNKKDSIVIEYKKLISYSLLFGLSTSIITFLVFFKPEYSTYYYPTPSSPIASSSTMASISTRSNFITW